MRNLFAKGVAFFILLFLIGFVTMLVLRENYNIDLLSIINQKRKEARQDNITDTNNSSTNDSNEVEISVTLPEGWKKIEGSVLEHQYMKNTASFILKNESFTANDLNKIVDQAKEVYTDRFPGLQYIGEVQDISINGAPAKKLEFITTISGLTMKFTYVYTIINDNVYVITLGDKSSTYDSMQSDFNTILNGIKY